MRKFDRDRKGLKETNGRSVSGNMSRSTLIRFGVTGASLAPVDIIYNYRSSDGCESTRSSSRALNVPRNVRPKSPPRDERRPTCGGCKKSEEIRRAGPPRSKWTRTRGSATPLCDRCWLRSRRWTSRPTLICTLEIQFSLFSQRLPIPPTFPSALPLGLAGAQYRPESGTQVRRHP